MESRIEQSRDSISSGEGDKTQAPILLGRKALNEKYQKNIEKLSGSEYAQYLQYMTQLFTYQSHGKITVQELNYLCDFLEEHGPESFGENLKEFLSALAYKRKSESENSKPSFNEESIFKERENRHKINKFAARWEEGITADNSEGTLEEGEDAVHSDEKVPPKSRWQKVKDRLYDPLGMKVELKEVSEKLADKATTTSSWSASVIFAILSIILHFVAKHLYKIIVVFFSLVVGVAVGFASAFPFAYVEYSTISKKTGKPKIVRRGWIPRILKILQFLALFGAAMAGLKKLIDIVTFFLSWDCNTDYSSGRLSKIGNFIEAQKQTYHVAICQRDSATGLPKCSDAWRNQFYCVEPVTCILDEELGTYLVGFMDEKSYKTYHLVKGDTTFGYYLKKAKKIVTKKFSWFTIVLLVGLFLGSVFGYVVGLIVYKFYNGLYSIPMPMLNFVKKTPREEKGKEKIDEEEAVCEDVVAEGKNRAGGKPKKGKRGSKQRKQYLAKRGRVRPMKIILVSDRTYDSEEDMIRSAVWGLDRRPRVAISMSQLRGFELAGYDLHNRYDRRDLGFGENDIIEVYNDRYNDENFDDWIQFDYRNEGAQRLEAAPRKPCPSFVATGKCQYLGGQKMCPYRHENIPSDYQNPNCPFGMECTRANCFLKHSDSRELLNEPAPPVKNDIGSEPVMVIGPCEGSSTAQVEVSQKKNVRFRIPVKCPSLVAVGQCRHPKGIRQCPYDHNGPLPAKNPLCKQDSKCGRQWCYWGHGENREPRLGVDKTLTKSTESTEKKIQEIVQEAPQKKLSRQARRRLAKKKKAESNQPKLPEPQKAPENKVELKDKDKHSKAFRRNLRRNFIIEHKEVAQAGSTSLDFDLLTKAVIPLENKDNNFWMNGVPYKDYVVTCKHLFSDEQIGKKRNGGKVTVWCPLYNKELTLVHFSEEFDLAFLTKPQGIPSKFTFADCDTKALPGVNVRYELQNDGKWHFLTTPGIAFKEKHQISTKDGSCGSPIICDGKIAGIHRASNSGAGYMIKASSVLDFYNSATGNQ